MMPITDKTLDVTKQGHSYQLGNEIIFKALMYHSGFRI